MEIFKQLVRETGMPVVQGNCNLQKPGSALLPFLWDFFFFFCLEILTQQENMGCSGGMKCRDSEAKLP